VVGGIWWILIGSFVRAAARGSYTRTVIRSVLDDAPVRRLMEPEVTPVEAGASLSRFAEDYVYRTGPRRFPVADEGEIIGYVDAEAVRDVPRREWDSHTVRELVHELSDDDVIPADATAGEAMRKLEETRQRSLVVTDAGHVEGVVTVDALTRYASNRVDLEDLRE
jgi:CBS domain-containing protein